MTSTTADNPPVPDEPGAEPRRSIWWLVVLWTVMLAALAWWVGSNRLQNYRQVVAAGATARLGGVKATLAVGFTQWAALPINLAHRPEVRDLVTRHGLAPGSLNAQEQITRYRAHLADPEVRSMNAQLDRLARDFSLPYAAVIDGSGPVLAVYSGSRAPSDTAPVDLGSRDYVTQALVHGTAMQFLLGRVSGVPGMYFSSRVDTDSGVAGVVVIKQDADVVNRLLGDDEDAVLLSDASGVVVLGNRPDQLLKRLPSAPVRTEAQWREIYQRVPEILSWQFGSLDLGARRVPVVETNGLRHVALSTELPGWPLTVWVLSPLTLERAILQGVGGVLGGMWLFGCALIWLGARRFQLLEVALRTRRELAVVTQAQRQSEARLAAVFEHAGEGYVFFDARQGITRCNPAALQLFGATEAEQLLGRVLWFPPLSTELQIDGESEGKSSRVRALEQLEIHSHSDERISTFEWRFCRTDGTPFDTDVSVILLDRDTRPQFCAVIRDITLRKQGEVAMQQARAAAEAASQTKSTFLANMSHELRTPMNAIIGMTHLALEDGLPDRQRDYIAKAHGSARNLLHILNDILDVSKIEAGHLDMERIDFELETVVGEMADVLSLRADEKGLEILFTATPDLPVRLVGDPTRLRQVLVNLGSNAIKFTDQGEVTIGMEVMSQDSDSVELHGWVRDTGPGMSSDELARIFQPFAQADSSTTRRFGGTGLGLVISRQLVERMGGRLWVDSTPGQGSTFHFTVRLGRSTPRAPTRAWMFGELRGRRALLVDDNDAALDVLGRMLESFGVVVDRANSGALALDLLQAHPDAYTWILLDWKMPIMDGVACARLMLLRYPQLRPCILLVTAFARDDALRASAGVPLAGLLHKPVTPSSLHDALLQASRVASPAPSEGMPYATANQGGVRQRLAGKRILLVEDHPLNQELACELLRRAGMQVVVAGDGQQALEVLANDGPFDGVLMDCQMPVMDGYTATRALRARPEWAALPVIAMTASALVEDRARALASGMNAHITKPINVELMLRTMADWIGPSQAAQSAEDTPEGGGWPVASAAGSIDTADGMTRCMGRPGLYRRVLRGFREATVHFETDFRLATTESRWSDALRAAHDLKGLAGTIGAHRLHTCAERLHSAVSARDMAALEEPLARTCEQLRTVLSEIDELVPPG